MTKKLVKATLETKKKHDNEIVTGAKTCRAQQPF